LAGLDVTTLDEVTLSEASIQLIFRLLKELNVVNAPADEDEDEYEYEEDGDGIVETETRSLFSDEMDGDATNDEEEEEEGYDAEAEAYFQAQFRDGGERVQVAAVVVGGGNYEEYEEDGYEDEEVDYYDKDSGGLGVAHPPITILPAQDTSHDVAAAAAWEGGRKQRAPENHRPQEQRRVAKSNAAKTVTSAAAAVEWPVIDETLLRHPVYMHLTDKLSFPPATAARPWKPGPL
jgi:hypothetical protein